MTKSVSIDGLVLKSTMKVGGFPSPQTNIESSAKDTFTDDVTTSMNLENAINHDTVITLEKLRQQSIN